MTASMGFLRLSHSSIEKKIIAAAICMKRIIHMSEPPGSSWNTGAAVFVVSNTMMSAVMNPARARLLLATAPNAASRNETIPK